MNLSQFKAILRTAVLVPFMGALLLAGILCWQIERLTKALQWVDHSDQVMTAASLVLRTAIDEETGLRGYEMSGDKTFLQPYFEGERNISGQIEKLQNLVSDDAGQEARSMEIARAYQDWHASALQSVESSGFPAAKVPLQANLDDKARMDKLRQKIADLVDAEESIRGERGARARHFSLGVVLISFATAGIFGLFFGLFTRAQLRSVANAFQRSLEESERRARQLYESHQWLQTVLNSIGDAVITCDAGGNIDFMNPVAEQLCGGKVDSFKGKPLVAAFNIVNEYTRSLVENPVDKVRRLNQVVGLANHTILISQDGTEYNIDDSGAPIRLEGGEIAGIVLVFRDITVAKKTQEAVIANEKLALASRLAATIAHEIHNPLDSVSNLLYLLAENPTPQESANYLSLARQELARVTQISRTMLSLYRESSSPVPVEIKELLTGALLMLDPKLRSLNVQVTTNLEDVRVEGFPSELRQVFANLIANAAEAADNGGTISIELAGVSPREDPSLPQGGARVEISDNGPGISEDVIGKLFRPFFTTKQEKGTGLGLWISRGIIEKHNGIIQVKSTTRMPDHGSTFVVLLPARVIPVAPLLEPPGV